MKNKLRALGKLQFLLSGFLVSFMLLLAGCGGGGGGGGTTVGGGIGGTGAVGTVSAIGSVTVNGLTYSCFGAVVTSDDGTIDQGLGDNCVEAEFTGQLSVGAVVTITGTRDANGNLTATTVSISRNVLGPVANKDLAGLSFTVLKQRVIVSETTRFEIGSPKSPSLGTAGLTNLRDGDPVEVSGFRNAKGDILASLVEAKTSVSGDSELKGIVAGSPAAVTIAGVSINLGSFLPAPANGACVEAKGTFNGTSLTLTQALKSDDDCNGGSVSGNLVQAEVEGVINGFVSATEFNVANQKVTTTATTTYIGGSLADLLNGVIVEAEGSTTNGTLIAKKIQIKSNGVRIEGNTDTALVDGKFTILGITVKVVASTKNSIAAIVSGTPLKLEGSKTGPTEVTAAEIDDASGSVTELRGPLDANPASPNFAILGVQVQTTGSTQFNGSSGAAASNAFFNNTIKDQIVKALGTPGGATTLNATEVENED